MSADRMTIPLEQYFDAFASASALAEANAFPTVSTGAYRVQVSKWEGKKVADDPRPFAHFTVGIYDEHGTKKLGTTFVDATWIEGRDQYGKLDRGFKYWADLTKALYPEASPDERSKKDVGTVLSDAIAFPLGAFVLEKFKVVDGTGQGKWTTVKSTEAEVAKEYRSAGFRAINTISNFSPLR